MLTRDLWDHLRAATPARIALGRAGHALPTAALLGFRLAHARARDAVHLGLDAADLARRLGTPSILLRSAAPDRFTYLRRPDLGRRLDENSRARIAPRPGATAWVVCDGLSALAVQRHAAPLLAACPVEGPVYIVAQGRGALGDEIGERALAAAVIVLIGERPGLSAPDSLGVYLTWAPRAGRTDAERNCISNIRAEGLGYEAAAAQIRWWLDAARSRGLSGVALGGPPPLA
jgi:ethanolamine ammonia-lyase small subunit